MSASTSASTKPALVVVDYQDDFCPPNGALAVPEALEILPILNNLVKLPFALKIATKDFHPKDHVSFASNHEPPNNKPFESEVTIANPYNSAETETIRLWPDHCVQGTPGSELHSDLDRSRFDHVVEKGQDARVEMYSAFAAPFSNPVVAESALEGTLKAAGITHVYVAALALDYCVRHTAIDAAKAGFTTFVIREATKAIDSSSKGLNAVDESFAKHDVQLISLNGPEMDMVKSHQQ